MTKSRGYVFIYCVFDGDLLIHVFLDKRDVIFFKKKYSGLYDSFTIRRIPISIYKKAESQMWISFLNT